MATVMVTNTVKVIMDNKYKNKALIRNDLCNYTNGKQYQNEFL